MSGMICRITEQKLYFDKKFYIDKKKEGYISQSLLIVPSGVTKFSGTNCMNYIYMNNRLSN